MQNGIVPGLDRFMSEGLPSIRGARLGVCCHPAAVDLQLRGLPELLLSSGVTVSRYFAPEHGLDGQLQDMELVTSTEPEVISLYGSTEESLRPVVSSI
ncbi:MAG: DUF1343 domain-containing protein [Proteobacteria bacterium]|nr:DUF1343 domain-containing protein [Pseudomonadota bacterium]